MARQKIETEFQGVSHRSENFVVERSGPMLELSHRHVISGFDFKAEYWPELLATINRANEHYEHLRMADLENPF